MMTINGFTDSEQRMKLSVFHDLVKSQQGLLLIRGKGEYDILRKIWRYQKLSKNQREQMEGALSKLGLKVLHFDEEKDAIQTGFPANEDFASLIYDKNYNFG